MKMSPDDKYLTVSTYMNEISVIEFIRKAKFNKAIEGDEVSLTVKYL